MAAEIESLKATVTDLVNDNESIKNILDIKQNEWTKIAEKKKLDHQRPILQKPQRKCLQPN